jgi:hypothetical protein
MKKVIASIIISILFLSCDKKSPEVILGEHTTSSVQSVVENIEIGLPQNELLPIVDKIVAFEFSQSQAIRFLSMGFNTCDDSYFFYGYEGYSEAFIYDSLRMSTGEPETFYPNGDITYPFPPYDYRRYDGKDNSIGYEHIIPTIGMFGSEYRFESGRLVYHAVTDHREPYLIAERIEQDNQSITIFFFFSSRSYSSIYYNISGVELLDIFF